jgi:hypothetical protein
MGRISFGNISRGIDYETKPENPSENYRELSITPLKTISGRSFWAEIEKCILKNKKPTLLEQQDPRRSAT